MEIMEIIKSAEEQAEHIFEKIDETALFNQKKVLDAFRKNRIALSHFSPSSGYGFEDTGKWKLGEVIADCVGAESAILSPLIASGTHALSLCLFGLLRPNDLMLSISAMPYESLCDAILKPGIGSLADFGVKFEKIDFLDGKLDEKKIVKTSKEKQPKLIFIQRSCGYTERDGLSIETLEGIISKIKAASPNSIVMIDNCYGTFMDKREPTDVGADIIVDSMIKNAGGGIAPTGAYIAGKRKYIDLIASRMTAPGLGNEVGSYAGLYTPFFQGIFLAPTVVAAALKGSVLAGVIAENFGYKTLPNTKTYPRDLIRKIFFGNKEDLILFIQAIQKSAPIDSFVLPVPSYMPGYSDDIIMASGSFIQGSSIELSCDAPLRPPYIAYFQGGLTYAHIKIALAEAFGAIKK